MIHVERSLARNSTASPTSQPVPSVPSGVTALRCSRASPVIPWAYTRGAQTMAGAATGLTWMPFQVVMHGHGLREADNRDLGCRVRDRRMATEQAGHRGHVGDRSAVGLVSIRWPGTERACARDDGGLPVRDIEIHSGLPKIHCARPWNNAPRLQVESGTDARAESMLRIVPRFEADQDSGHDSPHAAFPEFSADEGSARLGVCSRRRLRPGTASEASTPMSMTAAQTEKVIV